MVHRDDLIVDCWIFLTIIGACESNFFKVSIEVFINNALVGSFSLDSEILLSPWIPLD